MELKVDPHQLEALAHLKANPRAALFLGMSLSKTATALMYLHYMHYEDCAVSKTLVIAPSKVASVTWPDEINKWDFCEGMRYAVLDGDETQRLRKLEQDVEIYIISVNNLAWLIKLYMYRRISPTTELPYGAWLGAIPFDSIIIDELTLFKSQSSERWQYLERAIRPVTYRVGMTGTPAPNGLIDLWAQVKLLDDGARLENTFGEYVAKYFTTRRNGMIVYEYKLRPGAASIIAHKLRDIVLTMNTRDHVKIPPVFIVDHELELSPFDKGIYDELEREYVLKFLPREDEEDPATTVKTGADLTNKLLQISSGAIYEDRISVKDPHVWHELNTLKLDAMREVLAQYPGENFIVVYQYQHEVDRILKAFPQTRKLRNGKALIEGMRAWNAGEIPLLLLHPAGGGHGLNLQFGGWRELWFTPTWNAEHWEQTVARLPRRGATHDVFIHRLLVKHTRDFSVRTRINSKLTNQQFLMNEVKQLREKYYGKKNIY